MSHPADDEALVGTFANTLAWLYEANGRQRSVTAAGGVDLIVHFIKKETKLRVRMKERDCITAMWILNTYVPFDNPIGPGHKPNSYIFKHWSATEAGREPGKKDYIMVQFDCFPKAFQFVSIFMLAATQEADTIRRKLYYQPAVSQHQRRHEEEEVDEDVVDDDDEDGNDDENVDDNDDEDNDDDDDEDNDDNDDDDDASKSVDLLASDNDDDDDDDGDGNGRLGYADCSQLHFFR
jgi:hypothetical protein